LDIYGLSASYAFASLQGKIKTEYSGSHSFGVMQNKINHGPIRPSELWRILERELVEDFGERVAAFSTNTNIDA